MDPTRFDRFVRLFARDISRRTAVRRLGGTLAAAAVATGLPVARALAQDASPTAEEGEEELEGPIDEVPPDTRTLRPDCKPHGLGCRDWEGTGQCTFAYMTADCEIVVGRSCTCPSPGPVCTCQRICRSASGGITTTDINCP